MRLSRSLFFLLIAALLVRGLPFAHALPVPSGIGSATVAESTACEEHEGAAVASRQAQSDAPSCQIACDLAGAPALFTLPFLLPKQEPFARIAMRPRPHGLAARAPDLRPPIA